MEAMARANGFHRFEWIHRKLDGELSVRRVVREAESWTGDGGPQDDISLVALEVGRC